jgi:hypothetical protein
MHTVTGLYDSHDEARTVVNNLENAGISSTNISIVGRASETGETYAAEAAAVGAGGRFNGSESKTLRAAAAPAFGVVGIPENLQYLRPLEATPTTARAPVCVRNRLPLADWIANCCEPRLRRLALALSTQE